jgi:predicted dehydrogenase
MSKAGRTIALIGGGRWARVHASNLSKLLTSQDCVLWVSRHNQASQRAFVDQLPQASPAFELFSSVEEAYEARPSATLVVTRPENHFADTEACLRRGIHAFVEKPLAFRADEARALIDLTAKADLVLAVGVHLLSASYLSHFKDQIAGRRIQRLSVRWLDPAQEARYGENKQADDTTPLVHDVYPHIWSLVKMLTGCPQQRVVAVASTVDGAISFETQTGQVVAEARCSRRAPARERKVEVAFDGGETAFLDFTQEPGVAGLNGAAVPVDPAWGHTPRPVMAEVGAFLRQLDGSRDPDWPHLAANCLDSVVGAEALFTRLTSP